MGSRTSVSSPRIALGLVGIFLLSTLAGAAGFNGPGSSVAVSGNPPTVVVDLPTAGAVARTQIGLLDARNFNVTFNGSGLPVGTLWSVSLNESVNHSNSALVGFSVPNGTYPFTVGTIAGFVAGPAWGNVSVNNDSAMENITFTPFSYGVTFQESGLPGATSWGASLNGTPRTAPTTQIAFSAVNGTYPYAILPPTGFTATPTVGNLTVAHGPVVEAISFSPVLYPVNFSQTGLNATNWSVNLSGADELTNSTNLSFLEPNGTFSYSVGYVPGFHSTPTSGSFTVAGAGRTTNLTFAALPASKYPISFNETGLAPGTRWSVNLTIAHNSTTGTTLVYLKGNASYPYSVDPVSGYSVSPNNGSATIRGGLKVVNISFLPILYSVNLTEVGLPAGTAWSASLGNTVLGSSGGDINFEVANGTWPYAVEPVPGYVASPLNGSVNVSGTGATPEVSFSPVNYSVGFIETGLPEGVHWSVHLDGHSASGSGVRLDLAGANGTNAYSLGAVPAFSPIPLMGNVTVDGRDMVVSIAFTPFEFEVVFEEANLPSGTTWSVTLAGGTRQSEGTSIAFSEPNGTYPFEVPLVPGYSVLPSDGNVTVSGSSPHKDLTYTPLPPGEYAVTFTESGLPATPSWSVDLEGAIVNSTTNRVVYAETNGTYDYAIGAVPGYTSVPSSGAVTVDGGAKNISVAFSRVTPPTFAVTFSETGLPASMNWSVDLNGSLLWGTTSNLTAQEPDGSYPYQVGLLGGYNVSKPTGTVLVSGQSVVESVQFAVIPAPEYAVTFSETGLPTGTSWSVTLNGSTGSTDGATQNVAHLAPGIYAFTASASGFLAQPASGSVTVTTGPVNVTISFTPVGPAHGPTRSGDLSLPTLAFLGAMGIIVVAAIGIAIATRGSRRAKE